jgi:integrase
MYYGRTRADVARRLAVALKAQEDGLSAPSDKLTFAAFVKKWVAALPGTVSPRTAYGYDCLLQRHAVPVIGKIPLTKLRASDVIEVYKVRREKGAAPRSVLHLHRVLFLALKFAERWGDVPRNVAALVDAPKVPRTEMQSLSSEQARQLLRAAAGDRHEALLTLALATGMRSGEVLGLTWKHVDLEHGAVRVVAALQPTADGLALSQPKTARSRRAIEIDPRVVIALRQHRAAQAMARRVAGDGWDAPIPDLVFTTPTGAPIDGRDLLRSWLRPLLARAGLPPIRFHDLRHSYASIALAEGVHPKVVQEALGHSTIAITLDLYSHTVPSLQHDAARTMGAALFG